MCSVRRQLVLFHLPTHSRNIWKQLHPLPELNFTGLTAQCFLFFNAFRTNSADRSQGLGETQTIVVCILNVSGLGYLSNRP